MVTKANEKNTSEANNASEPEDKASELTAPSDASGASSTTALANNTIRNYMLATMGAGLIPLPLVDFLAFTGIQLAMINKLADQYGVPFRKDMGKSALFSLLSSAAPMAVAPLLGRGMLKLIPGLGSAAGMISTSLLGGAFTYAIGKVFQMHFESGGTLLTFDPEKMRDYFRTQLDKGKEMAAELRASAA